MLQHTIIDELVRNSMGTALGDEMRRCWIITSVATWWWVNSSDDGAPVSRYNIWIASGARSSQKSSHFVIVNLDLSVQSIIIAALTHLVQLPGKPPD